MDDDEFEHYRDEEEFENFEVEKDLPKSKTPDKLPDLEIAKVRRIIYNLLTGRLNY